MRKLLFIILISILTCGCDSPTWKYVNVKIIAINKNMNVTNWGCAQSSITTVRSSSGVVTNMCGYYGKVDSTFKAYLPV